MWHKKKGKVFVSMREQIAEKMGLHPAIAGVLNPIIAYFAIKTAVLRGRKTQQYIF